MKKNNLNDKFNLKMPNNLNSSESKKLVLNDLLSFGAIIGFGVGVALSLATHTNAKLRRK